MKNLISGMVLAVILCGLYATAQQPHVTQTLPSATVKLNGASGGGGTGTGFTYDAGEGAWIFTPPSGASDTRILSDYISLQDAAGVDIMAMDATLGATTYVAGRLAADAIEVRGITALSSSGTITATNIQCSTSGGAVVGTLDATAGNVGRFVYVTRDGANTCTIGVASGQTLDGVTDGTTTVANGGSKTFKQTSSTAWITTTEWPITGTISGLTATAIPYASSATALADSPLFRESADITSQRNGTNAQEHQIYATYSSAGANYERLAFRGVSTNIFRIASEKAGTGGTRQIRFAVDGTDYAIISSSGLNVGLGALFAGADTQNLGTTAALWGHVYNARGQQGSKSKALVDATATNIWQVAVANNSYEGFTLDYTIFATDGTDRQVIAGSTRVAVLNNGGTETCVFGTASEAVNTSTGTLTVTFDCTAGTDTVMVRANADTSLASTTTFTIESRPNLTSGTATVTPQ